VTTWTGGIWDYGIMSNKRIQKTGDRIRNWNNGILELWNDVKEEERSQKSHG